MSREKPATCFISAAADANIQSIKTILEERGIKCFDTKDVPWVSSGTLSSLFKDEIEKSDFVIGVLSLKFLNPNVVFEIGYAEGVKKPIFLIIEDEGLIPTDIKDMMYVRTSAINFDKIQFALDEFLSRYKYKKRQISLKKDVIRRSKNLENYIIDIENSMIQQYRGISIENIFSSIFLEDKLILIKDSSIDRDVDLAIWIDELEASFSNPILVEFKQTNLSDSTLNNAEIQLKNYLIKTNTRLGLLIYLDLQGKIYESSKYDLPLVLRFEARDLLKKLTKKNLAEIIISERNRLVHQGE